MLLRRYKPSEKNYLSKLITDKTVMRYVGNGKIYNQAETDNLWRRIHNVNYVEKKIGVWAVFDSKNSKYVGHAALKPRAENESEWEIVYYLLREEWGKGFGTEIARKLVEAGFKKFDLKAVYATVDEANKASIRILEKAGMWFLRYEFDEIGRFGVYVTSSEDQL